MCPQDGSVQTCLSRSSPSGTFSCVGVPHFSQYDGTEEDDDDVDERDVVMEEILMVSQARR